MKLLGIDTTKKNAKVFVLDTSRPQDMYYLEMAEGLKHSESLFLYIEKAMLDNKISIDELDGFVCVVGPGSFTGIRVGMSTIKGLNKAVNKVVIAINAFEALVDSVKMGYILLNSTSTSCYYAQVNKNEIVKVGVVEKSHVDEFCEGKDVFILEEEQNSISLEYKNIKVIHDLKELYSSAVMKKVDSGDYGDFVPYYLQLSQAERNVTND